MSKLYEIFSGNDLVIAEKIQQRRLQILVHSYLYYEKDTNIVSDSTWSRWAKELEKLQNEYPELSNKISFADAFIGWEGSTGAGLPYLEVADIAEKLIKIGNVKKKPEKPKQTNSKQLRLF